MTKQELKHLVIDEANKLSLEMFDVKTIRDELVHYQDDHGKIPFERLAGFTIVQANSFSARLLVEVLSQALPLDD